MVHGTASRGTGAEGSANGIRTSFHPVIRLILITVAETSKDPDVDRSGIGIVAEWEWRRATASLHPVIVKIV